MEEAEAKRDDVAEQRERLTEALRVYGAHYTELGRRFAAWLGLHSTDAIAVLQITAAEERGTPCHRHGSASGSPCPRERPPHC